MPKNIDYFLSVSSPWTYLGHARLLDMARRHGATITCKPTDFGKVFSVSGGLPLKQRAPQRQRYRLHELRRWQAFLNVPLVREPKNFPPPDVALPTRFTLAGADNAAVCTLAGAVLTALWANDRNISDPDTLKAIGNECGMDGAALLKAADGEAARKALDANTQEAIDRDVYGAPTYIYGDELWWGQDRLDFLDRALAAG